MCSCHHVLVITPQFYGGFLPYILLFDLADLCRGGDFVPTEPIKIPRSSSGSCRGGSFLDFLVFINQQCGQIIQNSSACHPVLPPPPPLPHVITRKTNLRQKARTPKGNLKAGRYLQRYCCTNRTPV